MNEEDEKYRSFIYGDDDSSMEMKQGIDENIIIQW
jgi:hypothetical protein